MLRALIAVELNSYIAILAPLKHKNQHYSSGAKGIFFFTFISWELKKKKLFLAWIKIKSVGSFFTFFYSHRASLSVCHSHLKLSSLKTLLSSLSQTITSLFHRHWPDSSSTLPPSKLDVTNPLVVPSCQSTSDPRHHQPQTDFSSTNPLQVSCLCLLHVDA